MDMKFLLDKLSTEQLQDLVLELKEDNVNLQEDFVRLTEEKKDLNWSLGYEMQKTSEAWASHTRSQKRVAQLFDHIERIAKILNQTDDVDDVDDVQIIEEIVEVIENEIPIVGGEFEIKEKI